MKNVELLLNPIFVKKTKKETYIIKNAIKTKGGSSLLNGVAFTKIVNELNHILLAETTDNTRIEFKFGKTFFRDKATYVLLESILYLLLRDYKFKIMLDIFPKLDGLYRGNVKKSLLFKYGDKKIIDPEAFIKDYKNNFSINNYRKILRYKNDANKDGETLSTFHSDLEFFLTNHILDEEYRENLSEAIIELVTNSFEHGETDCLIDIHIEDVFKDKGSKENYLSIDLVVVNFSSKLLGDGIKCKLENNGFNNSPNVKKILEEALESHQKYFSVGYTLEDFCNCASFQWRVSSRRGSSDLTGGTGLTTFIENLINTSENVYCYVYSGNRIINFKNVKVDPKTRLVGFNRNNDFLKSIPDKDSLDKSQFWLNGTLYNLNFIKKKEGDDNDND